MVLSGDEAKLDVRQCSLYLGPWQDHGRDVLPFGRTGVGIHQMNDGWLASFINVLLVYILAPVLVLSHGFEDASDLKVSLFYFGSLIQAGVISITIFRKWRHAVSASRRALVYWKPESQSNGSQHEEGDSVMLVATGKVWRRYGASVELKDLCHFSLQLFFFFCMGTWGEGKTWLLFSPFFRWPEST